MILKQTAQALAFIRYQTFSSKVRMRANWCFRIGLAFCTPGVFFSIKNYVTPPLGFSLILYLTNSENTISKLLECGVIIISGFTKASEQLLTCKAAVLCLTYS